MSERRKIEDRIRKKETEIQELEEKIHETRIYIQALQDVLKVFPKALSATASPSSELRHGSSVAKAREAILRQGVPLHINQLLQGIGKDVTRDSRISLAGSLAAYVRKGEIFTRPAPNTFGLIELGHVERSEHPPEEFGEMDEVETGSDDNVIMK
jgi:hypothetical protein